MKFIMSIMPPGQPESGPELHKFAVPAHADETFEDLWRHTQNRYEQEYRSREGMGGTEFNKMQDLDGADIFPSDRIGDFYCETQPHSQLHLKVHLRWVDHEQDTTVSALRPQWFRKRRLSDLDEHERETLKRARLEHPSVEEQQAHEDEGALDDSQHQEQQAHEDEGALDDSQHQEHHNDEEEDSIPQQVSPFDHANEIDEYGTHDITDNDFLMSELGSQVPPNKVTRGSSSRLMGWTKEEDDIISNCISEKRHYQGALDQLAAIGHIRTLVQLKNRIYKRRKDGTLPPTSYPKKAPKPPSRELATKCAIKSYLMDIRSSPPVLEPHSSVLEEPNAPIVEPSPSVFEPHSPVLEEQLSSVLEPRSPVLEPHSPVLEPRSPVLEPHSPVPEEPNAPVVESSLILDSDPIEDTPSNTQISHTILMNSEKSPEHNSFPQLSVAELLRQAKERANQEGCPSRTQEYFEEARLDAAMFRAVADENNTEIQRIKDLRTSHVKKHSPGLQDKPTKINFTPLPHPRQTLGRSRAFEGRRKRRPNRRLAGLFSPRPTQKSRFLLVDDDDDDDDDDGDSE